MLSIKHSGAENKIFWDNQVNITAADALAHHIANSSAAMVLAGNNRSLSSTKKELN